MDKNSIKFAKERTVAVNKLLKAGRSESNAVFTPEECEKWEKRAKMTPTERLEELANDNSSYKTSRLQQHFTNIKSIRAVNGSILLEVNEEGSKQKAIETAFKVLGPYAKEEEFKRYVAEHAMKTTLMPIKTFIRNLRNLTLMVAQAPQFFGESSGGSEVRDVLQAGVAAVKEARSYLHRNRYIIPPGLYKVLHGGDFSTTDKKEFANYLGDGWEKVVKEQEKLESAKKITKLVKL